ncbi:hypothetical protein ACF3NT_07260 [Naumannella halotolerans]|uniref:hypothetical protein n=1 Tax=Naumannella halotolerans TaxID=993414 RepID=UPI00105C3AD5|nr:hypothetical protein [Naumannella halotolerans]
MIERHRVHLGERELDPVGGSIHLDGTQLGDEAGDLFLVEPQPNPITPDPAGEPATPDRVHRVRLPIGRAHLGQAGGGSLRLSGCGHARLDPSAAVRGLPTP